MSHQQLTAKFDAFIHRTQNALRDEHPEINAKCQAASWIFARSKIWEILDICRKENPLTIVELGSGLSTLAFAQYQKESGAVVISIEESREYLAGTQGIVGQSDVEYILCDRQQDENNVNYDLSGVGVLQGGIDLCYIDGPSIVPRNVCIDALTIDARTFLFDMRVPSVAAFFQARMGYEFEPSFVCTKAIKERPRVNPDQYHNIFRRR